MVIRQVGVLSVGKILGVLYAIFGLLLGGLFSLVATVGFSGAGQDAGPFAAIFGVGAILILPLAYGAMGFIGGVVAAALYNLLAGMMGGIELEVTEGPGPEGHP